MHGILLCPGPSLARYSPEPADLVVAVNRAALTHRCDVWACGDWPFLEKIRDEVERKQAGKLPMLFTAAGSHAHLRDHSREWGDPSGADVVEFETLNDGHETDLQWSAFTATAALWYCFRRGIKHLRVFGADWGGLTYCDGAPISQNRVDLGESGWSLERNIWHRLTAVMQEHGVTVERITEKPMNTQKCTVCDREVTGAEASVGVHVACSCEMEFQPAPAEKPHCGVEQPGSSSGS